MNNIERGGDTGSEVVQRRLVCSYVHRHMNLQSTLLVVLDLLCVNSCALLFRRNLVRRPAS